MIIIKRSHGYGAKRKYIHGKGFVDSLSSSLKSIGSYVLENKDLIAKPLLGAVGNLAATGLTEGTKALLNRFMRKNGQNKATSGSASSSPDISQTNSPQLDSKSLAVLQNIIGDKTALGNIIGSGTKRTGSGIKKF